MLHSMISYWHHLSVCPSVCDAEHCDTKGWCRIPRMALAIHFLRHFCCGMHHLATAVSEKPYRQNFRVWNSHSQHCHVTMAIPDAAFSAVRFCSYTIRHTQYDIRCTQYCQLLSDSYACCCCYAFASTRLSDISIVKLYKHIHRVSKKHCHMTGSFWLLYLSFAIKC